MIIQIDGGGSVNKGAELMLVAVLQEIKRKVPQASLIINDTTSKEELIKSVFGENFRFMIRKSLAKLIPKFRLVGISRLFSKSLSYSLLGKKAKKGVIALFDIGGFQFGDQWGHNEESNSILRYYLTSLKKKDTYIIFLPQAFGPFENKQSLVLREILLNNSDLLFARDRISYDYLLDGKENTSFRNVHLFPDFTVLVKGKESKYSERAKGKVCIIPNSKIFEKGTLTEDDYISSLIQLIGHIKQKGEDAFVLNHEGEGDYNLCLKIANRLNFHIDIITGLNALETKGVIGASLFVISSRFHGVANALNSKVPCLATSWSHKYQMLLDEYLQGDCLIKLDDMNACYSMVDNMLDRTINKSIREQLASKVQQLSKQVYEMWDLVWETVNQ